LKHGRAIFNEVFWLRPNEVLGEIQAPTLLVYGTKGTFVPIESSRAAEPGGPLDNRPGLRGRVALVTGTPTAQDIQMRRPRARVVKGLDHVHAPHLTAALVRQRHHVVSQGLGRANPARPPVS
jgi:hypothetical protein